MIGSRIISPDADESDPLPEGAREMISSPYRSYAWEALMDAQKAGEDITYVEALRRGEELASNDLRLQSRRYLIPAQHDPRLTTGHADVVYYMRMDRLVKIGTSTNIRSRVNSIGPQGVMAVERGGNDVETARHRQFAALHSHLEWFHLGDELAEHIHATRAAFAKTEGMTVEEWLAAHSVRGYA
jgi:hypothetical protein